MAQGVIIKSLSGFYTVSVGDSIVECKARGRFRHDGFSPLVGDRVEVTVDAQGKGRIDAVLERRNYFIRPAVANVDQIVMFAAAVNPVTDPFLIDRVVAIAENAGCETVICLNKCDLDPAERLYEIYRTVGCRVICTSAATGFGIDALRDAIRGKTSAFTGNSGVGKSSILNRLMPELQIQTGAVSEKLGRGKHTTRHVELYALGEETYVADTPGFASFEVDMIEPISCENLQYAFREFRPYIGQCRFSDCAHLHEPGCAVLEALAAGKIAPERHQSYTKLYEIAQNTHEWEKKKT
ncbi:MAG: ribosome small subunit-dependent GTPase A [Clostridiales bacterium]|nr:ribosome small subunit-dependent GTPase A [Clostridiales bacterium]